MKYITPIQKINYVTGNINIYIKREDLLPISFGGNKARIAQEFFDGMDSKGMNCIIGYGNARSNLCRVLANINSIRGGICHIISPNDDDGAKKETSNSRLVGACNAIVHNCNKNQVAQTVESVINECVSQGLKPYYINGDKYGKGNEAIPVRAYAKVYDEIYQQSLELKVDFDYIFLATGTGMTQAGLLVGQNLKNGKEKIIGISVARDSNKVSEVIHNFLLSYAHDTSKEVSVSSDKICVVDDYLCGGYGKYNDEIKDIILNVYRTNGIHLDPTYTGKAFYGMVDYLEKNKIHDKNVLFIHTGGTPLFFDFINTINDAPKVTICNDVKKLKTFLGEIDSCLPVSLSERVDLSKYAEKVISSGKVLCIEKADKIVASSMFYCNDTKSKKGYLTLLGTLPEHEGKGYARVLMEEMEEFSRTSGISTMHLDTDCSNTKAVAFYSKCGYIIEKVDKKIHMMKEL